MYYRIPDNNTDRITIQKNITRISKLDCAFSILDYLLSVLQFDKYNAAFEIARLSSLLHKQ